MAVDSIKAELESAVRLENDAVPDIMTSATDLDTSATEPQISATSEPTSATDLNASATDQQTTITDPQTSTTNAQSSAMVIDSTPTQDSSTLFVKQDEAMDVTSETNEHGISEVGVESISLTPHKRIKAEPHTPPKMAPRKRQRVNLNHVPKYDDQQEKEASLLAVDQPCFREAEKLVPRICDMIIDAVEGLQKRGYHDEEIVMIMGNRLKNYRFVSQVYPPTDATGFLGDTAAGKSSLINALLNQENAAAECDEGDSGTSVIQEFHFTDVGQSAPVTATVWYHSPNKRRALVRKHFRDIWDYQHVDQDELDNDEFKVVETNNATALEFFTSLLCDRQEFDTITKTAAYIGSVASRDDKAAGDNLEEFITQYLKTLNHVEHTTTINGDSISDINRKLRCYRGPVKTANGAAAASSPWPIMRKIKTHLRARILSEGAVLADLPGTTDINKNRVLTTREYVNSCGTIVVAHPIARIRSQDTVWSNIVECIRAGKQSDIVLVCTKVDAMTHDAEREMPEKDRLILKNLQSEKEALEQEVEDLQMQLEDAEADGDGDDEYRTINRDLKEMIKQKAAATAKWKQEGILLRNRRNIEALQKKFKELTRSSRELPVFCVSNTIYQEHMRGYDITNPPNLSVQATDIPRLRQHIFEIPAKQKKAALMKLCTKDLPRVLLAIEMQCSKTRLERKQHVESKVVKPFIDFQGLLNVLKSNLKHDFEAAMQEVSDNHEDSWRAAAKRQHNAWEQYRYSRYAAFCRRWGEWKNGDKEEVSWNAIINEIVADDLLEAFARFKETSYQTRTQLLSKLDALLENLDADLRDSPELMGLNLDNFHKIIEITRSNVDENTTKLFRKLDARVGVIKGNATSTSTSKSYVNKSMFPIYENCKLRSGPGVFKQLKDVISTKLTGAKNLYADVVDSGITDFEGYVDGWVKDVITEVGDEFQGIISAFNMRFDNVEPEDEAKQGFRKELLEKVRQATRVMETEMKAQLDACAAYR